MTPQVSKANESVSLVDRVRGRKSTGGVGRASLARPWQVKEVAVQDADQGTPSENAGLGQQGVTDTERQVGLNSQMQIVPGSHTFYLCFLIRRLSRNEDVLHWLNLTYFSEETFLDRDGPLWVRVHPGRK